MKAIFNENTIAQILTVVSGFSLKDCFHEDIVKSAIDVPDYVTANCTLQDDGTWLDAEGVLIEESIQVEEDVVEEEPAAEDAAEEPAEDAA